mmetsp:Transcript_3086/g.5833  ORF Transcript_3086/g.5833 Transcript_3086/m.5833 type:complete len:143 (+) Transcript_3086:193-621(+)|eukprot:CAMPEP_0183702088 /NCGR_PEP_ID=MMETSP0737-20130205/303_1 /TAXON_ID=385413 /ORGANISM="Thalassiosira miniscula, Strain CCMP1093" /LENGTH=142 /DNA_ID=CAMNT_0025928631 /DNA_START=153 /DNA_END=581 /DNA_ORIENTATION=-
MISIVSSSVLKAAAVPARNIIAQRHLSMASASSVTKLNRILEEYRAKNYAQEFPKRFQKDVVKAATVNSRQLNVQAISAEGIEHVLQNIGMGHRMSRSEIEGIVSEVGTCPIGDSGHCVISADQMLDLISKNWEEHHHGLEE